MSIQRIERVLMLGLALMLGSTTSWAARPQARISMECNKTVQLMVLRFGPTGSATKKTHSFDALASWTSDDSFNPAHVPPERWECALSGGTYVVELGAASREGEVGMFCLSKYTAWARVTWRGKVALPRYVFNESCHVDNEGSVEYRFKPVTLITRKNQHTKIHLD